MASGTARAAVAIVVTLAVVIALGVGAFWWLRDRGLTEPVPGQQRCVATTNDRTVALDLDQAHFTSIVVGLSVRRGLSARAASIAMATVYQETGIRNLDYGDRDSVGLFQQRPSQGWGTPEQLIDPHFAAGRFYDALVKIKNWETDDINDVAQKVQRSGYPEAYRDHEADARVLASALTGRSPAAFTCLERAAAAGDGTGLRRSLRKTFGDIDVEVAGTSVVVRARTARLAWAYGQFAVANAKLYGVTRVVVGDHQWQTQDINLPEWESASPAGAAKRVEITLR